MKWQGKEFTVCLKERKMEEEKRRWEKIQRRDLTFGKRMQPRKDDVKLYVGSNLHMPIIFINTNFYFILSV